MTSPKAREFSCVSLGYTSALYLLLPLILGHTLIQALRTRELRYLRERLGFFRAHGGGKPVWIHAASVGEVMAAEPLVRGIRERWPGRTIALTTATPAGAGIARRRLAQVEHLYLPLDMPGAVRRFLGALDPACALIMETELWLNLYAHCRAKNIPVLVVNGRLSRRTLGAGPWLRRVYAATLANADAVLARSTGDRDAFLALGAPPERVKVIGNIKFAASGAANPPTPTPLSRPYVLAVSTHDDEELRLARLWQRLDRDRPLLAIAPRHPARRKDILEQLARLGASIAVRSRADAVTGETAIYLIDTFGELETFMAGAELVFVGGSLVPHGGHNVLEPARLGKAIVFGPHMENFADEVKTLLDAQAAIQIEGDAALASRLTELLASAQMRAALGRRAEELMRHHRDVVQRYIDEIAGRCGFAQG